MFWIGLIVGIVVATAAIAGIIGFSCYVMYGSMDTFKSMGNVIIAADMNRDCEVCVCKNNEVLETAVYKER